jgi:flagellar basal body-associated protein FliL
METSEQKPKKNTFIYIIIVILFIAILVVYYVFFGQEKLAQSGPSIKTINTATQEVGQVETVNQNDLYSSESTSTLDVTGGLKSLKLTPEDILNDEIFQSLQSYAEPVELPTLGRPNPFISY